MFSRKIAFSWRSIYSAKHFPAFFIIILFALLSRHRINALSCASGSRQTFVTLTFAVFHLISFQANRQCCLEKAATTAFLYTLTASSASASFVLFTALAVPTLTLYLVSNVDEVVVLTN